MRDLIFKSRYSKLEISVVPAVGLTVPTVV